MMKKYNKPETVTLALDMVDVIETSSGGDPHALAAAALESAGVNANNITKIEKQVTQMADTWSW